MLRFCNPLSVSRKAALLMTVGIAAMAMPAHAQEAVDAAAEAEDSGTDIVVVAQGRAQQLADVPLAISAVNAESLQNSGANDIRQLNQVAPSLMVSSTGSEANGSARIRGIGTVGDNPGLESSVAVFIDGVYRSRSGIGLNELGEIERVEVLRGPQGTLFGRNASAGLIHIISKKPSFTFGATGEATYGNYDYFRVAGGVTGPITDTIAARLDGVYVKRDGFYNDVNNDKDINNRNRYFVRGQLLFEPNDDLSVRLIGDYTNRKERCCAAVYVGQDVNPYVGDLNDPASNNIVRVLQDLGGALQPASSFNNGYSRDTYVTLGRSYAGKTTDGGVSLEVNYDFGAAKLTSITGWRKYSSDQGSDTDYSAADLLYRAADGNSKRKFETFSQELRLQGTAFDDKLDWLVGGYFSNEDLDMTDNLRFGEDYGRFASCRLVTGSALSSLYSPASDGCISAGGRAALNAGVVPGIGPAGALIVGGLDILDSVSDTGSTVDKYHQNSKNWAIFTHNIIHITDGLDFTIGARYTTEKKKFKATFGNDNTACQAQQALMTPYLGTGLNAVAAGLIGLSCQGNSTAELNGVSINDKRKDSQWTGTAVLSYKPNDDLMVYASYARGYKSGGFNLDRSALKNPIVPVATIDPLNPTAPPTIRYTTTFAALGGAQALVDNLQFDAEKVNAFEIGAKYQTGPFSLNIAAFRQDFKNFQLNTFNGSVFLVQNINGCSTALGDTDTDQSKFPGASNYNPQASTSGSCYDGKIKHGVRSQGVEIEATLVPIRDFRVGLGLTYADTKYSKDLVGNADGDPLDQALRMLPGNAMSNAPKWVGTGSVAWTPDLTSSLSGLFYIDGRMTSDYNTGSDLFPQKAQDGFFVANARIGIRGPDERWALELWGQNIFNKGYAQVAFNSPFQEGAATTAFSDPQYPGGRQIFSMYLAEPRTYGATVRFKM